MREGVLDSVCSNLHWMPAKLSFKLIELCANLLCSLADRRQSLCYNLRMQICL